MPTCVPIKDMRDTSAFLELVDGEAPRPVIVTKNGHDRFVAISSAEYDRLRETEDALALAQERLRLYEALLASEIQVQSGETLTLDEAAIHGIFHRVR